MSSTFSVFHCTNNRIYLVLIIVSIQYSNSSSTIILIPLHLNILYFISNYFDHTCTLEIASKKVLISTGWNLQPNWTFSFYIHIQILYIQQRGKSLHIFVVSLPHFVAVWCCCSFAMSQESIFSIQCKALLSK